MTKGTKSLLFGVHQVILHPITVYLAWVLLYRELPGWRETVCIIVHDWGYWGKAMMDDEAGERHPEVGAAIAGWLFGREYRMMCLCHSRHYARVLRERPSRLCWPDKLSILWETWWTYLPRAWLSGELFEYRDVADSAGLLSLRMTHREWFAWIRQHMQRAGETQRFNVVPYTNKERRHGQG